MSQCSVPSVRTGSLGNRWTSSSVEAAGAHLADHDPAAGRTEVDRRDRVGLTRHRQEEGRGHAGVDRDVQTGGVGQVGRVSTKTALATCSGSTSRLSSVRCA